MMRATGPGGRVLGGGSPEPVGGGSPEFVVGASVEDVAESSVADRGSDQTPRPTAATPKMSATTTSKPTLTRSDLLVRKGRLTMAFPREPRSARRKGHSP
jgi:hypothetical protein